MMVSLSNCTTCTCICYHASDRMEWKICTCTVAISFYTMFLSDSFIVPETLYRKSLGLAYTLCKCGITKWQTRSEIL